jgi:hypothetical protein
MRAEFYLLNQSFQCPSDNSLDDLKLRLETLEQDYSFIRANENDVIKKHYSIYDQIIINDLTVADILYCGKGKTLFNRDMIEQLRNIVDKSILDDISSQEAIIERLSLHNENIVHALLCLYEIENIDEKYLVYSKNNWLKFHRYFLGLYPKNVNFFFEECVKYFTNLYFHERNHDSIASIFTNFNKKIIEHLAYLDDFFEDCKTTPYNRVETLRRFTAQCNLDESATTEGNVTRKENFTFSFENTEKKQEKICCEPHLKLSRSDKYPGDSEYYFNRIYFHEGKSNIANGNILVGHIGSHL